MDKALKERRSRQEHHRVYLSRAERGEFYREHPASYGEMLEDGFEAVNHDRE